MLLFNLLEWEEEIDHIDANVEHFICLLLFVDKTVKERFPALHVTIMSSFTSLNANKLAIIYFTVIRKKTL